MKANKLILFIFIFGSLILQCLSALDFSRFANIAIKNTQGTCPTCLKYNQDTDKYSFIKCDTTVNQIKDSSKRFGVYLLTQSTYTISNHNTMTKQISHNGVNVDLIIEKLANSEAVRIKPNTEQSLCLTNDLTVAFPYEISPNDLFKPCLPLNSEISSSQVFTFETWMPIANMNNVRIELYYKNTNILLSKEHLNLIKTDFPDSSYVLNNGSSNMNVEIVNQNSSNPQIIELNDGTYTLSVTSSNMASMNAKYSFTYLSSITLPDNNRCFSIKFYVELVNTVELSTQEPNYDSILKLSSLNASCPENMAITKFSYNLVSTNLKLTYTCKETWPKKSIEFLTNYLDTDPFNIDSLHFHNVNCNPGRGINGFVLENKPSTNDIRYKYKCIDIIHSNNCGQYIDSTPWVGGTYSYTEMSGKDLGDGTKFITSFKLIGTGPPAAKIYTYSLC